MVADDHEGPLQLQLLGAPHPHPDAVEALEGQERGAQEPAEIRDEIRRRDTGGERVCTGLGRAAAALLEPGSGMLGFLTFAACEAQNSPGSHLSWAQLLAQSRGSCWAERVTSAGRWE